MHIRNHYFGGNKGLKRERKMNVVDNYFPSRLDFRVFEHMISVLLATIMTASFQSISWSLNFHFTISLSV